MNIKIKRIENGKLPSYETIGAAGADCYARINEKVIVKPKTIETIPLGFAVEIPEGFEMQIRGRSGNARKKWVQVFNSPGTIDSDYRGEVCAILYNASDIDFEINPFDRIAQAVVAPVIQAKWEEVTELSETRRGTGGFGSTGISENKEIEKFYEPFTKIEEVEKYFNHKVKIDDYLNGVVIGCKKDVEFNWFYVQIELDGNQKMNGSSSVEMSLSKAFERVKIEGHRFGKEIAFNENN